MSSVERSRVRETPSSPTSPSAVIPAGSEVVASVGRVESIGPAATPPVAVSGTPTIGVDRAMCFHIEQKRATPVVLVKDGSKGAELQDYRHLHQAHLGLKHERQPLQVRCQIIRELQRHRRSLDVMRNESGKAVV